VIPVPGVGRFFFFFLTFPAVSENFRTKVSRIDPTTPRTVRTIAAVGLMGVISFERSGSDLRRLTDRSIVFFVGGAKWSCPPRFSKVLVGVTQASGKSNRACSAGFPHYRNNKNAPVRRGALRQRLWMLKNTSAPLGFGEPGGLDDDHFRARPS